MTKETANIIKSITSAEKAYRADIIKHVFFLINSALNRHKENAGQIFLRSKVLLVEKKVRGGNLASLDVNVAESIYYDMEEHTIKVGGETPEYDDIIIGDFDTMPIGMVEEVVKAIIEVAKSE